MECLIVGGGGIGSWLVRRLARLRNHKQLGGLNKLVVADSDTVENKNIPYQNFGIDEIMDSKALCLDVKYGILGKEKRITSHEDLASYNIIICAVDNTKTRRLVFDHCIKNQQKYFIDLRAEGTAVWGITSDAGWSLKQLYETLGNDEDEDTSCQLEYELSSGIIQLGNVIIAEIGAQWLLNHLRMKKNPSVFSYRF